MIFLITNSRLCKPQLMLLKIREAAMAGVDYILLRENHLDDEAYKDLALSSLQMLTGSKTELVICHRDGLADDLGLKKHNRFLERSSSSFTVATHSQEEVRQIPGLYFYSPIFETTCKPGVPPKGVDFCSKNLIALGGVCLETLPLLTGFDHIGVMSEWLQTPDVYHLIKSYRRYGY